MGNYSGQLLLIFIKNPEAGKVKTRLAHSIGHKKALEVYQKLLAITQKNTADLPCDRQIWYSRFIDRSDIWEEDNYQKRLQRGADLGERMTAAFREAFIGEYQKVIVIGSDCAELTPGIIKKAFQQLETHDMVIGPSQDGGYYLLGMQSFYEDLFSGITWSTSTVYQETIGRADELELSYYTLPTLNDIDTQKDLIQSNIKLEEL